MMQLRGHGAIVAATLMAVAAPATAQTAQAPSAIDQRIARLERELRAVQRNVFPGGSVTPELGGATPPATAAGNGATTPVADLTARIDSLERQLATATGANEQAGFRVRQLEESVARLQSRLSAVEAGPGATTSASASEPAVRREEIVEPVRTTSTTGANPGTRPSRPASTLTPARVDPARRGAIAAVEVPVTGDAVEDEYTYAFRLYSAKLYPEAQAKLKAFTQGHPTTSKRWSYAQNLLGRAYFDEGKPALASVALYDNYQKAPRGERASESLYWLGRALTRLNKLADACKVYDELQDVYGAKLTSDARARAAKGRDDAKCAA